MSSNPVEYKLTARSKTTPYGTETWPITVYEGQSVQEVAERVASGYNAEVVTVVRCEQVVIDRRTD